MRVCLMIEGQEDVTWPQWLALARACEAHGVEGLFRSDHYRGGLRGTGGSLDAWATLAGLAAATSRLRLGTMVSPVTFRPAGVLAKNVVTVDHISGGRVELGIGAGWNESEHRQHGLPFPPARDRVALLAQQVETIVRHWTDDDVHPKPVQRPHPPLIVGGTARPGTLAPAVRFADEYNTFAAGLDDLRERRERLDRACEAAGRDPASIRFTLMNTCIVAADRAGVDAALKRLFSLPGARGWAAGSGPPPHWFVGTPSELAERLNTYADVIDGVYLQHLLHDELDPVELIGRELAPALT